MLKRNNRKYNFSISVYALGFIRENTITRLHRAVSRTGELICQLLLTRHCLYDRIEQLIQHEGPFTPAPQMVQEKSA